MDVVINLKLSDKDKTPIYSEGTIIAINENGTLGNNIYYELLKAIRNPPSIESFQQQIVDASKYTKTKKKKIILNNDDNDDENDDNSNMLQSVLFQFNTYNTLAEKHYQSFIEDFCINLLNPGGKK